MRKTSLSVTAVAALLGLSACASLPSLPVAGGPARVADCPVFASGQGPYAPPFPADCAQVQSDGSGLRWLEIAPGDPTKGTPGADSTVVLSYQGFLEASGAAVFSSYTDNQPDVLQVADMIPGWASVVQNMSPGAEWLIFVPAALAYGAEPLGEAIPGNSDLVFRTQLNGFLSAADLAAATAAATPPAPAPVEEAAPPALVAAAGPDMAAWQAFLPWDPKRAGVNKLPSGLSYVLLERGNSTMRNAILSDTVVVDYEGRLAETTDFFDSSWSRGEPAAFPVGGLIPGFTEMLTYMRPGDRVLAHIPAAIAYGEKGAGADIPPNSDLVFQINLLQIVPASAE